MTVSRPPLEAIRHHLPSNVTVISFAGRAVCVLYLARYDERSTLSYHELIVATLVRHGWQWGAWIPLIYVDSKQSLIGGREIWHLPKEMAEFSWSRSAISVSAAGVPLCSMRTAQGAGVTLPLFAPALTQKQGMPARFTVRGRATIHRQSTDIDVPQASPLRPYGFDRCKSMFSLNELSGTISAPRS